MAGGDYILPGDPEWWAERFAWLAGADGGGAEAGGLTVVSPSPSPSPSQWPASSLSTGLRPAPSSRTSGSSITGTDG